MESPLVCMLPNSTTRFRPGNWNRSPGLSKTNSTTAITTGPQSAISLSLSLSRSLSNFQLLIISLHKYGSGDDSVRKGVRRRRREKMVSAAQATAAREGGEAAAAREGGEGSSGDGSARRGRGAAAREGAEGGDGKRVRAVVHGEDRARKEGQRQYELCSINKKVLHIRVWTGSGEIFDPLHGYRIRATDAHKNLSYIIC